jgi:hypothetical protein
MRHLRRQERVDGPCGVGPRTRRHDLSVPARFDVALGRRIRGVDVHHKQQRALRVGGIRR